MLFSGRCIASAGFLVSYGMMDAILHPPQMRSLLPITFLLLITACTPAPAIPSTTSPEDLINVAEEDSLAEASFSIARYWGPEFVWEGPSRGTSRTSIHIDDQHTIPAGAIQATLLQTTWSADDDLYRIFDGAGRMAFVLRAKELGWMVHTGVDADGPMGTQWGLTIATPDGRRFLIVEAGGKECEEGLDFPVGCPVYEATITITDPLPSDADL